MLSHESCPMKILVIGINYAPELVGIGPYTAGMSQYLARAGHSVTVICAKPYYPQWKVNPDYAKSGRLTSDEYGVRIVRVPTYVPSQPNGMRRLLHHMSFTVRAEMAMLSETRRSQPDVVIGIAPSLISVIVARDAAKRTGAKLWLHIQDFEVEAAFATGLLRDKGLLARVAKRFELWAIQSDLVSTISPQMCQKLVEKGVPSERVIEFRNWTNINNLSAPTGSSAYRTEWNIDRPHVALYSGNIANKQGIEIIIEAAKRLTHRHDLMFVVCGEGANRKRLKEQAAGLDNIRFFDLQPVERLPELLGMASIHLLPQIAGAADLVLPSKLTNMLASGRAVVATALQGTGLAAEVEGCGLVTPPGDAAAFADAIETLLDDDTARAIYGRAARVRAEEHWSRDAILDRFNTRLQQVGQQ